MQWGINFRDLNLYFLFFSQNCLYNAMGWNQKRENNYSFLIRGEIHPIMDTMKYVIIGGQVASPSVSMKIAFRIF